MKTLFQSLAGITLSLTLVLGSNAFGQETTEEEEADPRTAIEEMTVTAEKRESTLQETPISVQAFGAEEIERLGIQNTKDIGWFTPGVTISPATNGNGQISIFGRGIGTSDNHAIRDQAVGMYVDGVYIGTGNAALFDLLDLERIEALKGPQGTLFGRNTIGGALNIVTVKPGPDPAGRFKLTYGQHNQMGFAGSVNAPLIGDETLMARVSFSRRHRDAFFQNTTGGDDFDDDDSTGFRAALRWNPSDDLTIDYSFDRIEVREHNPAFQLTRNLAVFGVLPPNPGQFPPRTDNGNIANDGEHFMEFDTYQHTLTSALDVNDSLTLKLITGWRKYRLSAQNDLDGSAVNIFHSGSHVTQRTFSQELQAIGDLFGGSLDYTLGAYFFDDESSTRGFSSIFQDPAVATAAGLPFPGAPSNTNVTIGNNSALGYFGQSTLHATEQLDLTVGLRYTSERKEATRSLCGGNPGLVIANASCPTLGFPNTSTGGPLSLAPSTDDVRFDAWSPLFRIAYDWTDGLMTYVSWTRGYRAGGFGNRLADGSAASRTPFEEEKVSAWETGFKSRWFDDRLVFNWSGYYNEFDDQQITQFIPGGGTATRIVNAGKSRIRGFEFDVRALPLPGLELMVTHGWTHATFSEFIDADPVTGVLGNQASTREYVHTPKRTWTGGVAYTFEPMNFGSLTLSGTFQRRSQVNFLGEKVKNENMKAGKFTTYDARIALDDAFGREGLSLALIGRNLTDRSYVDNGIDFSPLGWSGNTYGDPRHFYAELGYAY